MRGGEDPPSLSGHLDGGEPVVKPTLIKLKGRFSLVYRSGKYIQGSEVGEDG